MRNTVFIARVSTWTWAKRLGFLHQKVTTQSLGPQGTSASNHVSGSCEWWFGC